MNGGTSPSTTATPIRTGPPLRPFAALSTQEPTASQKTIRKKKSRFRMTCQVPEEKKSWTPPSMLAITGGFFRSSIQRETRARRSPPGSTSRTRRRSACRQRGPTYALTLGEIGQEVKGARDEQRISGRPAAGKRLHRILDRIDLDEVTPRALRQVGRCEGA